MNPSAKYSLNKTDLLKIGKGALVAGAGALATYLLSAIGQIDFGAYTPLVVSLLSIGANALHKYLTGLEVAQ